MLLTYSSRIYQLPLTRQFITTQFKSFSTSQYNRMPQALKAEEVNSKTDPSVSKQWDNEVSLDKKIEVCHHLS